MANVTGMLSLIHKTVSPNKKKSGKEPQGQVQNDLTDDVLTSLPEWKMLEEIQKANVVLLIRYQVVSRSSSGICHTYDNCV